MVYRPLTMARRHILGDLYRSCDRGETIPVYLRDESGEQLGHAEESGGPYSDAFTFYISEDNCRKMAGGQFDYSFGTELSGTAAGDRRSTRRVRLTSILLVPRAGAVTTPLSADVVNPSEDKPKRRRLLF